MEQAPDTSLGTPHYIYVISDPHRRAVKVGYAKDPRKRLDSIQTGNATKLHVHHMFRTDCLQDARKVERRTHDHLIANALMGEWFAVKPDEAACGIFDAAAALGVSLLTIRPGQTPFVGRTVIGRWSVKHSPPSAD